MSQTESGAIEGFVEELRGAYPGKLVEAPITKNGTVFIRAEVGMNELRMRISENEIVCEDYFGGFGKYDSPEWETICRGKTTDPDRFEFNFEYVNQAYAARADFLPALHILDRHSSHRITQAFRLGANNILSEWPESE